MASTDIILPTRLATLLEQDAAAASAVHRVRDTFGVLLSANRLEFFPEYTDHGIGHIEGVLSACEYLISDASWASLSAADAAVLVIATVLHDCAMHIQKDGFLHLVTGRWRLPPISWFAAHGVDRTWPEEWETFVGRVRHYDGHRNADLFGDPDPVPPPTLTTAADWTEKQRMMIGEFIRIHHGRLAQEIALAGFPGKDGPVFSLPTELNELGDLSGLVARSHCLSLRQCVDFLESVFKNKRDPHKTHAVYLMVLLRIADFLEMDARRAPDELAGLRSLRSPISRREWKGHKAIRDISFSGDDNECVVVQVRPPDVTTYIRSRRLLDGLQEELDRSWAALQEVYAPTESRIGRFHIRIRRVRSNLDEPEWCQHHLGFVAKDVRLRTANAEVLRLLVRPLYGEHLEIAVRELLQNAVDAVRERDDYLRRNPDRHTRIPPHVSGSDAEIVVAIETCDGEAYLRVTDAGVGMTVDVIADYFLCAGASFRNSEAWRREYLHPQGGAPVLRTGRFGVGVLAAFLAGDEVEVLTRNIHDERGLRFIYRVDEGPIELRYVEGAPFGTSLRVRLDAQSHKQLTQKGGLAWDWYRLTYPRVARFIDGKPISTSLPRFPGPGESLSPAWSRLSVEGFLDVQWTFAKAPNVIHNGIVVGENATARGYHHHLSWLGDEGFSFRVPLAVPKTSVFDADGRLPLNLQRTKLQSNRYAFADQLMDDVARDFCAFCLVHAPSTASPFGPTGAPVMGYPGYSIEETDLAMLTPMCFFLFTKEGTTVLHPGHMAMYRPRRLLAVISLGYAVSLNQ